MEPFNKPYHSLLLLCSFVVVAFGQPAWVWWMGLLASAAGFACLWRVLLALPRPSHRFWLAFGWYSAVQVVQLSWMVSHPFAYIYAVLLLLACLFGAQFGFLALWIIPENIRSWGRLGGLAALWTLLEWSRLFLFSGYSLNPVGLALSSSLYSMQLASIGGVFLLSFWVMLTNLSVLRCWMEGVHSKAVSVTIGLILFPYLFGWLHFHYHEKRLMQQDTSLSVLLVQPALPIEENMHFQSAEEARAFVLHEWKIILATMVPYLHRQVDLIVMPEYLVPYGTFHAIYPLQEVKALLLELYGPQVEAAFPHVESPWAEWVDTSQGPRWWVTNAYLAQTVANLFKADLVAGLEDSEYEEGHNASYSSAFHFKPGQVVPMRYEKQVLLPMGEYIPFDWCKKLAARYGISGSFTAGAEAKIFEGTVPMGASICYEETFGNLMRNIRLKGGELLVNLTNDGWYPHSRLVYQHFDHARLRTVESGIPLVRACNTGLTAACDSLGRVLAYIEPEKPNALHVNVPRYHYKTIYTFLGDSLVVGLCVLVLGRAFLGPFHRSSKERRDQRDHRDGKDSSN